MGVTWCRYSARAYHSGIINCSSSAACQRRILLPTYGKDLCGCGVEHKYGQCCNSDRGPEQAVSHRSKRTISYVPRRSHEQCYCTVSAGARAVAWKRVCGG